MNYTVGSYVNEWVEWPVSGTVAGRFQRQPATKTKFCILIAIQGKGGFVLKKTKNLFSGEAKNCFIRKIHGVPILNSYTHFFYKHMAV